MVEYATTSGGIVVPLPPNKPDYSSNVTEDQGFFGRVGDALQTLTKTAAQYLVNRELAKLDREDEIKQAEHLAKLRSKYKLYLIKIYCPLEICYYRIAQRDQTEQIPVSDSRVRAINEKASRVVLDWDLEIDNSGPALIQDIILQFKGI